MNQNPESNMEPLHSTHPPDAYADPDRPAPHRRATTAAMLGLVLACVALMQCTPGEPVSGLRRDHRGHYSKPVCPPDASPDGGRCHAWVRTDDQGNILVRSTPDVLANGGLGLAPGDLQFAYNIPVGDVGGAGLVVAVIDAGDAPSAESDLAAYRSRFGLPPCTTANGCLRKVAQDGSTRLPPVVMGWDLEISLDLDMVSAGCPACRILLVEASTQNLADLLAANQTAVSLGARYVSNSWGYGESSSPVTPAVLANDGPLFDQPTASFFASTGDFGFGVSYLANGVSYPAASPFVTAVGGTYLDPPPVPGGGFLESVWDSQDDFGAPGSGCSVRFARPSWQVGVDTGACTSRNLSDVSAVADGLAVYSNGRWMTVRGTSASSPLVAAIYANARHAARPGDAYFEPDAFFDITSGTNFVSGDPACSDPVQCNARAGWDGPTGIGSPDGAKLARRQTAIHWVAATSAIL